MDNYIKLLRQHDWYYAYSDDGTVYRRGDAERGVLNSLRKCLDPDGFVWNSHAPADWRVNV